MNRIAKYVVSFGFGLTLIGGSTVGAIALAGSPDSGAVENPAAASPTAPASGQKADPTMFDFSKLPNCIPIGDGFGNTPGCVAKSDIYGPDGPQWDKLGSKPGFDVLDQNGNRVGSVVNGLGIFVPSNLAEDPVALPLLRKCLKDVSAGLDKTSSCAAVLDQVGRY